MVGLGTRNFWGRIERVNSRDFEIDKAPKTCEDYSVNVSTYLILAADYVLIGPCLLLNSMYVCIVCRNDSAKQVRDTLVPRPAKIFGNRSRSLG